MAKVDASFFASSSAGFEGKCGVVSACWLLSSVSGRLVSFDFLLFRGET